MISGEPTIIINKIDKNYEDGILTYTYKDLRYFINKNKFNKNLNF